jgi:hypothetical protein
MESIPDVFANLASAFADVDDDEDGADAMHRRGSRRRVQASHEAAATQGGEPPGTAHEVHGERQGLAPSPARQRRVLVVHASGGVVRASSVQLISALRVRLWERRVSLTLGPPHGAGADDHGVVPQGQQCSRRLCASASP